MPANILHAPGGSGGGAAPAYGQLVLAGDSIGAGYLAFKSSACSTGLGAGVGVSNLAVPSETLATEYSRESGGAAYSAYYTRLKPSVLIIQGGTNDFYFNGSLTAATLYSATLTPFVALAQARGMIVAVCTLLPFVIGSNGRTTAMDTQRQAYNALVRANAAGADLVIDVAADSIMGDAAGNTGSTAWFIDGLHPTSAGQAQIGAAQYAPALKTLLALPPRLIPLTLTSPSWGSGKFAGGLVGGSAVVPVSSHPAGGLLQPFTVEAQVKTTNSSSLAVIMGQTQGGNFSWFAAVNSGGTFYCGFNGAGGVASTINIADGAEHHIEVTLGATCYAFVDGAPAFSPVAGASIAPDTAMTIGNYTLGSTSYPWGYGAISDVAISNGQKHNAAFTPPSAAYTGQEPNLSALYALNGDGAGVV